MLRIIQPCVIKTKFVITNGLSSVVLKNKVYDISLSLGLFSMIGNTEIKKEHKLQLYKHLVKKHPSTKMFELGNMCPTYALPMGEDMIELYSQCITHNKENELKDIDIYVNATTNEHVEKALQNNISNINFLLSSSLSFQTMSYYTDIEDVENTIEWSQRLKVPPKNGRIHVDCLTECPMEGMISLKSIIQKLACYLYEFPRYKLSLGNSRRQLTPKDFYNLVSKLTSYVGYDISDRLAVQFSIPLADKQLQKETKSFIEEYPEIQLHVSAINGEYNVPAKYQGSSYNVLTYQALNDLRN